MYIVTDGEHRGLPVDDSAPEEGRQRIRWNDLASGSSQSRSSQRSRRPAGRTARQRKYHSDVGRINLFIFINFKFFNFLSLTIVIELSEV